MAWRRLFLSPLTGYMSWVLSLKSPSRFLTTATVRMAFREVTVTRSGLPNLHVSDPELKLRPFDSRVYIAGSGFFLLAVFGALLPCGRFLLWCVPALSFPFSIRLGGAKALVVYLVLRMLELGRQP